MTAAEEAREGAGAPPAEHSGRALDRAPRRAPPEAEQEELAARVAELEALYGLAAALGRAAALSEIYDEALSGLSRALRVERAAVLRIDPDGVMRFKAWRGLSEAYRRAVEGHSPWAAGDPAPAPIFVPRVEDDPALARLLPVLRAEGIGAVAFLPLVASGRLLGKLMIYHPRPHEFIESEVRLGRAIASQVAIAIERKIGEEERARLLEEARRAVRARDEFVAVAAHELRTPISALRLNAGFLRAALEQGAGAVRPGVRPLDLARAIERAAARLSTLIENVFDVSLLRAKGEIPLRRERVDLAALARDTVELFRDTLARAGCEVVVRAPQPVVGSWDRSRLEQALLNLLSNAAKFAAGGPVEIAVSGDERTARIAVTDSGPGVPPERREAIFEKFERAVTEEEERGGGLGLGLYVAREIVRAHGGTIRCEGEPGRGATFAIELPGEQDQAPPFRDPDGTPPRRR